jgi:hypothetical protein
MPPFISSGILILSAEGAKERSSFALHVILSREAAKDLLILPSGNQPPPTNHAP